LLLSCRFVGRPPLKEDGQRQTDQFDTDQTENDSEVLAKTMLQVGTVRNDFEALLVSVNRLTKFVCLPRYCAKMGSSGESGRSAAS